MNERRALTKRGKQMMLNTQAARKKSPTIVGLFAMRQCNHRRAGNSGIIVAAPFVQAFQLHHPSHPYLAS